MALEWDLCLCFAAEHESKAKDVLSALDEAGLDASLDDKSVVFVTAPEALLAMEAAHRGLAVDTAAELLPNQRLDMARVSVVSLRASPLWLSLQAVFIGVCVLASQSLLDHVRLPSQQGGKALLLHDWIRDGVCELILPHERRPSLELFKATMRAFRAPVQQLRSYFGEHVTVRSTLLCGPSTLCGLCVTKASGFTRTTLRCTLPGPTTSTGG